MSEAFKELKHFDDIHLKLLYRMLYDHWTWDSDSSKEKELIEAIETEQQERHMHNTGPVYDYEFYCGNSYHQFDSSRFDGVRIGAGQFNDELSIKANGIKLNDREVVKGTSGIIQFSWDLEQEIRRMAQEEIRNMMDGHDGPVSESKAREVAQEEISKKIKKIFDVK